MDIKITGRNIDATEAIKSYINEKIGSLEKFAPDLIEADVQIEQSSFRNDKNKFKVFVNFKLPQDLLHVDQTEDTLYAAIDDAREEMERQLKKRKGKFESKKRVAQKFKRSLKSAV